MDKFEFRKNNFNLIRFLAALQVVIVHGYHHFGIEYGKWFIKILSVFPGVPIFFVTSGFLISASLERSTSLSSYFQNRFLRIYPALWVCFIISVATIFIFFSPIFTMKEFGLWALAQLTIGQFYNPDFLRGYGVGVLNGSLWTIPIEIQFYIFLPLLYMFFNKIRWNSIVLFIMMIFFVGISRYYINGYAESENTLIKLIGVSLPLYLYMFLFGVFLQRKLEFIEKYLANRFIYWLSIYLAFVFASYSLGFIYGGNNINPLLALLLAILTISAAYSKTSVFSGFLKGYDISYGIYIYHMVFVNILLQTAIFSPSINMLVMLIATIVTAVLSWKIIEKPSLSLKKYSINSKTTSTL